MLDVRTELSRAVRAVLAASGVGDEVEAVVERSARPEFGDFSTPAPLRAARVLRRRPLEIAEELRGRLEALHLDFVAGWTVSPPGYVNCQLEDRVWAGAVLDQALGLDLGAPLVVPGEPPAAGRTLVEHTATNPNKAAHVGHLRNACIGDSVARILRRLGHEVEVQNYIDDTGVQVADVAVGLRHLGIEPEPGEAFDQYCSRVYVEVGRRYETDPDLVEQRRRTLREIEAGEGETARFVKELASRVVDRHLATMRRFDIGYDLLTWESDIIAYGFWSQAFDLLRETGSIVHVSEGRHAGCWVMPSEEDDAAEDDAKVLVKSDGVATYTAKDIAYQLWKFGLLGRDFRYRRWHPDDPASPATTTTGEAELPAAAFGRASRVINVIDARQAYPQEVVKRGLARTGHPREAEQSIHLAYEVVALSPAAAEALGLSVEDGKNAYAFSGRRGIEVRADDLLDKALERVGEKAADPETAAMLAAGAVRYYLEKFTLSQIIAFDFDEALRVTGDTGIYLMYSHARAAGIMRKVAAAPEGDGVPALEVVERALLHALDGYRHALAEAGAGLSPSTLCTYSFELASTLTDFYEHTEAIVREQDPVRRAFRRRLVAATRATLADALWCLGMPAPDRV
ncbi:MAG: arginine--tRNA ligase [Candidatus Dormibacteria bacterium]|jgi:arginyl-tRNA synthetase|nr:arginine--tRNA ligase [Chloroflexota bacterium]